MQRLSTSEFRRRYREKEYLIYFGALGIVFGQLISVLWFIVCVAVFTEPQIPLISGWIVQLSPILLVPWLVICEYIDRCCIRLHNLVGNPRFILFLSGELGVMSVQFAAAVTNRAFGISFDEHTTMASMMVLWVACMDIAAAFAAVLAMHGFTTFKMPYRINPVFNDDTGPLSPVIDDHSDSEPATIPTTTTRSVNSGNKSISYEDRIQIIHTISQAANLIRSINEFMRHTTASRRDDLEQPDATDAIATESQADIGVAQHQSDQHDERHDTDARQQPQAQVSAPRSAV